MPTLRDIKRRIRAVNNTRQITKAMKMVAAAKLRKSQARMLDLRPYAEIMREGLKNIARNTETGIHPLLAARPRKTVQVIVITSDRGLCGAFNTNIVKAATKHVAGLRDEGFNIVISAIGKKAVDYLKRRNIPIRNSWTGLSGRVTYSSAQEVAKDIIEDYVNEAVDEVVIIYNEFKTVMTQHVSVVRLLPLVSLEEEEGEKSLEGDIIFEPSPEEIFNTLLPKNVEIQVFRALLESQASEEAARMTTMENATKSANDVIESLTLQYNKARQASITKELMDIVGGVEALKG
ncbi:MAG TPA: ATP synthase F1 subunit gamma [Thermodesulfovibrionales bacterium]|jgi:F-type H+-transporting ATPase subunit gamma|nr:ATP synthase F1 subunit gamma [Thermodesulfovibrionales bacterium]